MYHRVFGSFNHKYDNQQNTAYFDMKAINYQSCITQLAVHNIRKEKDFTFSENIPRYNVIIFILS